MQTLYVLTIVVLLWVFVYYITKAVCTDVEMFTLGKPDGKPRVLVVGTAHGNEPAGSEALNHLLRLFKTKQITLKAGQLTVIPTMNKCGKTLGIRYQPHQVLSIFGAPHSDLNRNFPATNGEQGACDVSKAVAQQIASHDLVIDLHEGWGFHKLQPKSMGSAVYPTNLPLSHQVAQSMIQAVNHSIPDEKKQFMIEQEQSPVKGSLRQFCEQSGVPYVLIETTGQNNIQPLTTRANQHLTMVLEGLKSLKMI
jgi:predicted deacylase